MKKPVNKRYLITVKRTTDVKEVWSTVCF